MMHTVPVQAGREYARTERLEAQRIARLELQCERARDRRLMVERKRRIAYCLKHYQQSSDFCARYYSDYGGARPSAIPGFVRPQQYNDLPECIAAFRARQNPRLIR
jgi:hypothetical protein